MELLPVTKDFDQISAHVRTFTANALYEMIAGLRPYVAEALADPAGIHDLEPSRLVAYTQLLKLQSSLLKDLGLLYRVQDRPIPEGEERLPASVVTGMLAEQAARHEEQLAALAADVETKVRAELAQREQRSLQAAKDQVAGSLQALARR